ncbi:fatty acid--CoA ligase [Pseudomonas brassicacearum]|nr:fatty acid--CoA ligase [Pseudomonas brassicacearum]KAB0528511.1 fatty acid--CoA ligase [Pseudomonas brassicacearum subsp. brassicacearum]NJP59271.1 fatty acid--CoA ligase [Pseudomonas brassicacearum]SDP21606.1 fatty-acyl-CoA synthase [Pseudomonas brassicacearum]
MVKTKIISPAQGAYSYPLLIKSLLLSGQRYEAEQEIVYADKLRYSYRTLNKRIRQMANVLTAAGVKAGDTVAMLDWDSHRYLECFFAVPMIGAVLHMVNIRLSPEQVLYTMNHAEDDLVLVHDDFLPLLEQIHGGLSSVKGYIQLSEGAAKVTSLPVLGEYEQLLSQSLVDYDFPEFDENSVATVFYTTGTTGKPKGVYFSHRQLVLHTLAAVGTLGAYRGLPILRSDDVYMPITPMFHVHAWGVPYVATLMGVKQVYPGRYEPNALVRLYREEKVTFSHCVPTVLQMILTCPEAAQTDFSGWKLLLGGSALALGAASQAAERGMLVHTGYGMSETCPLLSSTYLRPHELALPMDEQLPLRIKTGVPMAMVDMRVIDSNGQIVPHNGESVGEIVVRAPWLTQGYLHDPEKGAELWEGGWLHTGDIGSIDAHGVLEIKDRIKDVIKTGGEWISSLELESLISEHPAIMSVAVVGIPDIQWGERPMAMIVCAPLSQLTQADLEQHLLQFVDNGRITKWAIPKKFVFVDDIPKTSVGKVDKKKIRENESADLPSESIRHIEQ